jgi:hypothetical protein
MKDIHGTRKRPARFEFGDTVMLVNGNVGLRYIGVSRSVWNGGVLIRLTKTNHKKVRAFARRLSRTQRPHGIGVMFDDGQLKYLPPPEAKHGG